jgi:FKBP-type peptidyl-prolyl cis-trans isomerase
MKRIFLLPVLAVLSLSFAACGKQADKTTAKPAATSTASVDQKVSYGIGFQMGSSLPKDAGLTIDQAELTAGIADAIAGSKSKYSEADLQAAFLTMQQKLQAAGAALAEKQLALGNEYCAKNKTRPGVKTTASGLQYEVLKKGLGGAKPKATDTVKVHYHGTLIDGTVFDSSVQRGEPIEFPLNQVIPGWTEGVQLMSVGDKFKFTIPAALAYGPRPKGQIPGNSVLIFEVELLAIK